MKRQRQSVACPWHSSPNHPSIHVHHLAQIQNSVLESTIWFCAKPFWGISEQKFTLLPFIKQSGPFKQSVPGRFELALTQTAFIKCFLKECVSSSEAWGEGVLRLLSCFLIKLSWFRGQGKEEERIFPIQIPKPFLLWLFDLPNVYPTDAPEPFRPAWQVPVRLPGVTPLPSGPDVLAPAMVFGLIK